MVNQDFSDARRLHTYTLILLSTLQTAAIADTGQPGKPAPLCTTTEKTYFSCTTEKGKIISLCGIGDPTSALALQYRFGTREKVELAYPEKPIEADTVFSYAHYGRYQVDRSVVNFQNGDFKYSIFDSYEGDQSPPVVSQGVEVLNKKGDVLATRRCVSGTESHLPELQDKLPCDAGDPLQMGECPAR